jgi:hypothetical protein
MFTCERRGWIGREVRRELCSGINQAGSKGTEHAAFLMLSVSPQDG